MRDQQAIMPCPGLSASPMAPKCGSLLLKQPGVARSRPEDANACVDGWMNGYGCIYVWMCVCVCVYVYIYIYMHTCAINIINTQQGQFKPLSFSEMRVSTRLGRLRGNGSCSSHSFVLLLAESPCKIPLNLRL